MIYSIKHTVGMYHRQCIMRPVTVIVVTNLLHETSNINVHLSLFLIKLQAINTVKV